MKSPACQNNHQGNVLQEVLTKHCPDSTFHWYSQEITKQLSGGHSELKDKLFLFFPAIQKLTYFYSKFSLSTSKILFSLFSFIVRAMYLAGREAGFCVLDRFEQESVPRGLECP
jgi:hypothetical protein